MDRPWAQRLRRQLRRQQVVATAVAVAVVAVAVAVVATAVVAAVLLQPPAATAPLLAARLQVRRAGDVCEQRYRPIVTLRLSVLVMLASLLHGGWRNAVLSTLCCLNACQQLPCTPVAAMRGWAGNCAKTT